jgi:DNA polymerase-4
MKYYKKESQKLFSIFRRYTDKIEKVSYSTAFLDITEDKTGHESAVDLGTELKEVILKEMGLHSSVGISVNKFMAKVAMDYKRPNGFTVIYPKDVKHYIDNLEIEKFEIFLPATIRKLHRLKIKYGRDIRKMKKADMIINFGRTAQQIIEIADGIDNRPLKLDTDLK